MTEATKQAATERAPAQTVSLTIDGRPVTVIRGTTVLEAAAQLGIHIPSFCWHPKLKPVGACRMCYVEIERFPKLQVSCATEATDGMVVLTDSDKVRQGRRAVLEFILVNHPLDCPTCDKGGECDLQNLTFAHGFDDSRFEFQKARFAGPGVTTTFDDLRIGPEIILNRNRCILCFKCVRANKEAFGEYDLGAYERGNSTEINAAPGHQVDNPFSGNLVEICPVGALTNTDWRYKIRVWLTKTTPSMDNFFSSGANILFYKEDHQNRVFRVTSRRNDEIDDGWLADVTRYGYQIVNSPERLVTPLIKKDGRLVPASWEEALQLVAQRFGDIKEKKGGVCIGGLAAPYLDNASLYSFARFFRTVIRCNNIDFRSDYRMLPDNPESQFSNLCSRPFRIADIDDSDVTVIFGSDLIREHPGEYLRLRKARNFGHPRIYSLTPYAVKSADVADRAIVYKPGTEELVINALCLAAAEQGLVDSSAAAQLKDKISSHTFAEATRRCGVSEADLLAVAGSLAEGRMVTFIVGEIVAQSKARETIATAIANLDHLLGLSRRGQVAVLARYANSKGAERLGLLPRPTEAIAKELAAIWGDFPDSPAYPTDAMAALMKKGELDGFFILGANPMMLYPDRAFMKEGLEKLDFLVVCDMFETETTALADVVLPLSSWAEFTGDYVNLEGRVQRAYQAVKPSGQSRPGFEIMTMLAEKFGEPLFESAESMAQEIERLLRLETTPKTPSEFAEVKVSEEANDDAYPIALFVVDDAHHSGHLTEKAPSLTSFAGEAYVEMSPDLAARMEIENGDAVRVEAESGRIIVPARISEHLNTDVILIPRNFSATPVTSLLSRKRRVDRVKLLKVDH
ncbi:MAG TPA: NADH-quinone oxidoreductase subunit NuoG [Candidatus Deferrimicrobium sp.]|nr:NADH-quinone oxidoreductase subunit NuoG [Candidatus Deferrimicrobium sp.]